MYNNNKIPNIIYIYITSNNRVYTINNHTDDVCIYITLFHIIIIIAAVP